MSLYEKWRERWIDYYFTGDAYVKQLKVIYYLFEGKDDNYIYISAFDRIDHLRKQYRFSLNDDKWLVEGKQANTDDEYKKLFRGG